MKIKAGLMIAIVGFIFAFNSKAVFSQSVPTPAPEPIEESILPSIVPTVEPIITISPTPAEIIQPTPSLEPAPIATPSSSELIPSTPTPQPIEDPVLQIPEPSPKPSLTPTPTPSKPDPTPTIQTIGGKSNLDSKKDDKPKSEDAPKNDNGKNNNDDKKAKPKEEVLGAKSIMENVVLPTKESINKSYSNIIKAPIAFILSFDSPNLYSNEKLPRGTYYSLLFTSLIFLLTGFSLLNSAFARYLLSRLRYAIIKIRLMKNSLVQFAKFQYLLYLTAKKQPG